MRDPLMVTGIGELVKEGVRDPLLGRRRWCNNEDDDGATTVRRRGCSFHPTDFCNVKVGTTFFVGGVCQDGRIVRWGFGYVCMYCYVKASSVSVGCAGCLDQSRLSIQSGQQIADAPYCC